MCRIGISMGGALPAGKASRQGSDGPELRAGQGCGKRKLGSELMRPHRIEQLTKLVTRVGPTQDGGSGLAR